MIKLIGKTAVLNELAKTINVVSSSVTEGLIEVGERGVGFLKQETPVDTGRLRNSMSYTIDNKVYEPLGQAISEDRLRKQKAKDEVDIGTNVIYAPSVEYRAKNGSAGFMQRAYRMTVGVAEQVMAKVIKGAIK